MTKLIFQNPLRRLQHAPRQPKSKRRTQYSGTWVHIRLLEKQDNKQTNYSINNNGACVSFIGEHAWGEGKAPETP